MNIWVINLSLFPLLKFPHLFANGSLCRLIVFEGFLAFCYDNIFQAHVVLFLPQARVSCSPWSPGFFPCEMVL